MSEKQRAPVAVENLRRIWELKKSEMQITQAQAAKKLGWTQGAFSQYLNNLTTLNPSAVIKLANFLGVDPQEIEPNINDYLPHVLKVQIRYAASNPQKRIRDSYAYLDTSPDYFFVLVDENIKGAPPVPYGSTIRCTEYKPTKKIMRSTKIPKLHFLILRENEEKLEYVSELDAPPSKHLQIKWLIHGFTIY